MSADHENCPSAIQLLSLVEGDLPTDRSAQLYNHIEHCSHCQQFLENQSSLAALEVSSADQGIAAEPVLMQLIGKLQREFPPISVDAYRIANQRQQETIAEPPSFFSDSKTDFTAIKLGQYELVERIGQGASGVVYRAIDHRLDRTVAIKILAGPLAQGDDAVQRLWREAKSGARLEHPNIVRLYDVASEESGQPFLVFEYVQGESLQALLNRQGLLAPQRAVEIMLDTLAGSEAAHRAGFIHRDIKPANILIDMKTAKAKLADFGLAIDHELQSKLTADGFIAGTPAYMSPEQIGDPSSVNYLTDVYSLGVVLYQMLTGEVPFRGLGRSTLERVIHEEPQPPRKINKTVPKDLETICLKALAKKPAHRYQTMQKFSQDLTNWRDGFPISAQPITRAGRTLRWARRNPLQAGLWTALAALIAILCGGSIISSLVLANANRYVNAAKQHSDQVADEAAAQRDALLETMQMLVYEVNDTVEQEFVDQDELQAELLKIALKGLGDVAEYAEKQALVDRRTADVHFRLGKVFSRLDKPKQAARHLQIAKSTIEQILAAQTRDRDSRRLEIQIAWELATLNSLYDGEREALEQFEVAQKLLAEFSQTFSSGYLPSDVPMLIDAASGSLSYGDHQAALDQAAAANAAYESTLAIVSDINAFADPLETDVEVSNLFFQSTNLSADAYAGLADTAWQTGDTLQAGKYDSLSSQLLRKLEVYTSGDSNLSFADEDAAVESVEATLLYWKRRLRTLSNRGSGNPDELVRMGTCHQQLRDAFSELNRLEQAEQHGAQYVQLLKTLAAQNDGENRLQRPEQKPGKTADSRLDLRLDLIEAMMQLAAIRKKQGNLDELADMLAEIEMEIEQAAKLATDDGHARRINHLQFELQEFNKD